jgi:hypothetical protein
MNYPEPKLNPACQCKGNPVKAFWCQHGHMLECHYPYDCQTAGCNHLHKYGFEPPEIAASEAAAREAIKAGKMPPYKLDATGQVIVEIKPTEAVDRSAHAPTLPELIRQAVHYGADRFSFVGPRQGVHPPFLAVVMLTHKAVREVGPFLQSHLAALKQDPRQRLLVEDDTSVAKVFEAMQANGQEWLWLQLNIMEADGLAVFIIGDSITETFAAQLTARGCTTNLK